MVARRRWVERPCSGVKRVVEKCATSDPKSFAVERYIAGRPGWLDARGIAPVWRAPRPGSLDNDRGSQHREHQNPDDDVPASGSNAGGDLLHRLALTRKRAAPVNPGPGTRMLPAARGRDA